MRKKYHCCFQLISKGVFDQLKYPTQFLFIYFFISSYFFFTFNLFVCVQAHNSTSLQMINFRLIIEAKSSNYFLLFCIFSCLLNLSFKMMQSNFHSYFVIHFIIFLLNTFKISINLPFKILNVLQCFILL